MKKFPLTALAFFFLTNPNLKVGNISNPSLDYSFVKNSKKGDLENPTFSTNYLSKFNLRENSSLEINKEITLNIPPRSLLNLDDSLINLSPDLVKSITHPYEEPTKFTKFAYVLNETDKISKIKINYDSNSVLNITTDSLSKIRNGPFLAIPENGDVKVSSFYGPSNVIPMKVFLDWENGIEEKIEFVDEKNYPPYFISKKFSNKDSLTHDDTKEILDSYDNLYGDYFKVNYKALVCTEVATLLLKTTGIDLEKEFRDKKVHGNSYWQKNPPVIKSYVKKVSKNKTHLFKNGNLEKILKAEDFSNMTPESFGIEKFSPGQVIVLSRFYKTGNLKGRVQRSDVHFATIYETDGEKIGKVKMVTSHEKNPPYEKNIKLGTIDFEKLYQGVLRYTGSNETSEELTYRANSIIDWLDVINEIKKENRVKSN